MSELSYYSLHTLSRTPGYPPRDWFQEYSRNRRCPGCGLPEPGPVDVCLAYKPDRAVLNIVTGTGVGLARTEFLEALGMEAVVKNLDLGSVTVGGHIVEGYVTFRGRKLLPLRGKEDSLEEVFCGTCGQGQWRGFPRGARYLLANDITGAAIYESTIHQLVVNEETYRAASRIKWTYLGHQRLPVVAA